MTKPNRNLARFLIGTFALLAASIAPALEPPEESTYRDFSKMPISGKMTFEITSVKVIAGGSWGEGILSYQGQDYPLKVKAATAGGIGYRSIKGVGDVYNLNRLEDFAGIYGGGTVGATVVEAGGGVATLENNKRVVIQAKVTDSKGVQLSLAAGGIQIKFADQ